MNEIPVGLAPMEGVTDFPVRAWFRLVSAPDFVCTPFLRVTPTYPHKGLPAAFLPEGPAHLASTLPQLMAARLDDFLRVAGRVVERAGTIDINCGCPAPLAVGAGAGSSILADPDAFHQMARRLHAVLGRQAGIKMRTGYNHDHSFATLLAGIASLDLARLTIHGRTRADGYTGRARWDLIALASDHVEAPVWVSGDIVDLASWQRMRRQCPRAAGAMIGRGALRNPWIFRELREGRTISVTGRELTLALASLGQMLALFREAPGRLAAWAAEHRPACHDATCWREIWRELSVLRGEPFCEPESMELDRFALGRVKMLWNYLRSSLPETWFAPQTFRQKTAAGFFEALASLADDPVAPIPLVHQARWDRLYSGASRAPRVRQAPRRKDAARTIDHAGVLA